MVNAAFAFGRAPRQNRRMHDDAISAGIEVDPERLLALAYAPPAARPAIASLWLLDARLGSVLATTSDPAIGMIRLAWWRDALCRLDTAPPPAEPLLRQVAETVLPAVSGTDLAGLAESWGAVLDDAPDGLAGWDARGRTLFGLAARLLGGPAEPLERAGAGWSLADLAHGTRDAPVQQAALRAADAAMQDWDGRAPAGLRMLGMLGLLARIDAGRIGAPMARRGAPARIARMLRYHLFGR